MLITLTELGLAFTIALFAWVFVNILLDEDMIFEKWQDILYRLPKFLAKPLGGCDKCMSGSLAFWLFFFSGEYNPVRHFAFVALAIFFVGIVDWLHCKISN